MLKHEATRVLMCWQLLCCVVDRESIFVRAYRVGSCGPLETYPLGQQRSIGDVQYITTKVVVLVAC